MWAAAAKEQNVRLRASLEKQAATKMDVKTVDSSKLDWSAAEDNSDTDIAIDYQDTVPRLKQGSILTACFGRLLLLLYTFPFVQYCELSPVPLRQSAEQ